MTLPRGYNCTEGQAGTTSKINEDCQFSFIFQNFTALDSTRTSSDRSLIIGIEQSKKFQNLIFDEILKLSIAISLPNCTLPSPENLYTESSFLNVNFNNASDARCYKAPDVYFQSPSKIEIRDSAILLGNLWVIGKSAYVLVGILIRRASSLSTK